jgi:hypothetical protein
MALLPIGHSIHRRFSILAVAALAHVLMVSPEFRGAPVQLPLFLLCVFLAPFYLIVLAQPHVVHGGPLVLGAVLLWVLVILAIFADHACSGRWARIVATIAFGLWLLAQIGIAGSLLVHSYEARWAF